MQSCQNIGTNQVEKFMFLTKFIENLLFKELISHKMNQDIEFTEILIKAEYKILLITQKKVL